MTATVKFATMLAISNYAGELSRMKIAKTIFWTLYPGRNYYPIREMRDKITPLAGNLATCSEILTIAYSHAGRTRIPGSLPRHLCWPAARPMGQI